MVVRLFWWKRRELVRADFVVGVVCYLQAMADDVTRVLKPPSLVRISVLRSLYIPIPKFVYFGIKNLIFFKMKDIFIIFNDVHDVRT